MIPLPFLVLTFTISLAGFACIPAIPAARSPESAIGLPGYLALAGLGILLVWPRTGQSGLTWLLPVD